MLSPEAGGGGRRPGTRGASRLSGRGGPLQHAAQTCSPLKAHMSSAAPSGPSCSPNCSCLPILLHYPRVLKCRFYYHLGAVSASGQVTADTQTVARLLPGGGATPSHTATAPRGSTRLVRRLREKMRASAFVVASQEGAGQARPGKQAWEWLVWIISGGSGARGYPYLSGTGPGVVRAGG